MLAEVELSEDLRRTAEAAVRYAAPGEDVTGIVPTEPVPGERAYLCAYAANGEPSAWLVLDGAARPVESRARVREAVSIAALCEVAEEVAGGGDLDELLSQLVALRITEDPDGIDDAEAAVRALQGAIGAAPRLATPAHLDAVGTATRKLERALGDAAASPFAAAMQQATATVEELLNDVESNYKRPLV
jgi:hypothetical protein